MSKVTGNYQAIEFFIVNLSLHQRLNLTSSSKAITLGRRQALYHMIPGVSERLIRYSLSRHVLPNNSSSLKKFLYVCMYWREGERKRYFEISITSTFPLNTCLYFYCRQYLYISLQLYFFQILPDVCFVSYPPPLDTFIEMLTAFFTMTYKARAFIFLNDIFSFQWYLILLCISGTPGFYWGGGQRSLYFGNFSFS